MELGTIFPQFDTWEKFQALHDKVDKISSKYCTKRYVNVNIRFVNK